DHFVLVVGEVAPAELAIGQADEAACLQAVKQFLAEIAVEDFVRRCGVLEDEGEVKDLQGLGKVGQHTNGRGGNLDVSALGAFDHLALAAKLAVGEDVNIDAAIGALFNQLLELHERFVLGRFSGDDVRSNDV